MVMAEWWEFSTGIDSEGRCPLSSHEAGNSIWPPERECCREFFVTRRARAPALRSPETLGQTTGSGQRVSISLAVRVARKQFKRVESKPASGNTARFSPAPFKRDSRPSIASRETFKRDHGCFLPLFRAIYNFMFSFGFASITKFI